MLAAAILLMPRAAVADDVQTTTAAGPAEGSKAGDAKASSDGKSSKGKSSKKKKGKKKKSSKADAKADDGKTADDGPSVPEPPPAGSGDASGAQPLQLKLPLKVKGKLPKSSKGRLIGRLEAAVASTSIEGGPYTVKMSVVFSKKNNYTFTVTASGPDGKTVVEVSDECKGCSLTDAGNKVAALVAQAATDIENLPPPPGTLAVTTVPPGAQVSVDGKPLGPSPQSVALPPGEHEVLVEQEGFEPQRQMVMVESKGAESLDLTLDKAVVAAPPDDGKKRKRKDKKKDKEPKVEYTGPKAGKKWTVAGGAVLGAGVAGALLGVLFILIDEGPVPTKCKDAAVDFRGVCRYRYDTLLGGALGVAGGALGIGGGIALMVKGRKVTMAARANQTQATLGVRVRF